MLREHSKTGAMDVEIYRRLNRRDYLAALDTLVRAYEHEVVRFCTGMLGTDGEDVAQEVFLSAYDAMPRFKQTASVRTWLYSIARNQCRKALREHRRRQHRYRQARDIAQNAHSELSDQSGPESDDPIELIPTLLQELNEQERAIVLMRSREALTHDDIAKMLGISKRSVERKWSQALKTLGGRLKDAMG